MATKLLPPSIDGKLPAQVGNILHIPYLHNRAVGTNDYDSMSLKLKTVSTNLELATVEGDANGNFSITDNDDEPIVELKIGQYYKAQIAYKSGDLVGYYSTVGVFKYTDEPKLSLSSNNKDFTTNRKNYCGWDLIGKYKAPATDTNEKVYSYCFTVYEDGNIFATSGELLHNASSDTDPTSSIDVFHLNRELKSNNSLYSAQYEVTTSNGFKVATPRYFIDKAPEVPLDFGVSLEAHADYENGAIELAMFKPIGVTSVDIKGHFQLVRSSDLDNYESKEVIQEFKIDDIVNDSIYPLYKDFTVQQGVRYRYGLQQYSVNNIYSTPLESEEVCADFEDSFLFDGVRQLKIKFNPKVSSFKTTILESKMDTIGGQFPFVFRNGNTNYKEFPISGLISYHMDNDELFLTDEDLRFAAQPERRSATAANSAQKLSVRSTNLTGDNIAAERIFKLAVLDWLNDGKPKLFRSPTEGNYIVRVMNTSLSPNDTVGRMLHTFSATAYEIAENSIANYIKYNFIGDIEDKTILRVYSIEIENQEPYSFEPAAWARIYGRPGTQYKLYFKSEESLSIRIGGTGMREMYFESDPLISITLQAYGFEGLDTTYETKIEFAAPANTDYIYLNGNLVESIESEEKLVQFSTEESPTDIIDKLLNTDNIGEFKTLDNILFLRLEAEDDKEKTIIFTFENDENVKVILNQRIKINNTNATIADNDYTNAFERVISGHLELTAEDFDGHFAPLAILAPAGVRIDAFYKTTTCTMKEADSNVVS